jgi:hypothetical protein
LELIMRSVIRILDAELDPMPLDCEDHSRVHVWVTALAWESRRAFLTSGEPLMAFMAWEPKDYSSANVASLIGLRFIAEFDEPARAPELGERIELRNVSFPPGLEEILPPGAGFVCGRCRRPTGNRHQGHYWAFCQVTKTERDFHFCCPGDCALEGGAR